MTANAVRAEAVISGVSVTCVITPCIDLPPCVVPAIKSAIEQSGAILIQSSDRQFARSGILPQFTCRSPLVKAAGSLKAAGSRCLERTNRLASSDAERQFSLSSPEEPERDAQAVKTVATTIRPRQSVALPRQAVVGVSAPRCIFLQGSAVIAAESVDCDSVLSQVSKACAIQRTSHPLSKRKIKLLARALRFLYVQESR